MTTSQHPPGSVPGSLRWLRRIVSILTWIEVTFGALCVLVILVLVFTQALQRYLAGGDIAWTGELSKFGLVWLTFSVAGVLVTTRGHIALEVVDIIPNQMTVRIIQALSLTILAVIGFGLTMEALALVETQGIIKSPVLRVPMSWVYIPVLVGVVSMTIRSIVAAVDIAWHGPILAEHDDEPTEAPIA